MVAVVGLLAAAASLRPDPLQPVAEVEGILGLAFGQSAVIGAGACVLLVAIVALPAAATRDAPPPARLAGLALSLCFGAWALTPLLGAFPVPFVGIGMSAILGAWLGVGLLAGMLRPGEAAVDAG
jgi:hypothetical protein